jgi:hypothetical protein
MKLAFVLVFFCVSCNQAFAQGGTADCPGGKVSVPCAVKSTILCSTLFPNTTNSSCENQYTECSGDSDCAGRENVVLVGTNQVDSHYPAFQGEAGNTTVCFTGEKTICLSKKKCSNCKLIQGASLVQKYCTSEGVSWEVSSFNNFIMKNPCVGQGEPE